MLLFEAGKWAAVTTLSTALSLLGPTFTYDGRPFEASRWTAEISGASPHAVDRRIDQSGSFVSPDGRLRLDVEARFWQDFPVVEIIPRLSCATNEPTGVIGDFCAARIETRHFDSERGVRLRRISGSESRRSDFLRNDVVLRSHPEDANHLSFGERSGYVSYHWLPYFGLDFSATEGIEYAYGWMGNWQLDLAFRGGSKILFAMALPDTSFRLRPGESYRMPSSLVYLRQRESVQQMQTRFHRFIVDHKAPRDSKGRLLEPLQTWGLSGGNQTLESNLKVLGFRARHQKEMPAQIVWMDAGWYGVHTNVVTRGNCGNWAVALGDFRVNPFQHPGGTLRPVSDAAHAQGCRFLLWFEPERAHGRVPGREAHPTWYYPSDLNADWAMLRFDIPAARAWATEQVLKVMNENGVDIYRQDSNLGSALGDRWRKIDELEGPARRGIAEIAHVNGLWAHYDAIRAARPDSFVENCASGGRRLDYETMSRCHSYCRDDAQMYGGNQQLSQNITLNATPYLPFTGGETFVASCPDDYAMASYMSAGTVFGPIDLHIPLDDSDPARTAWLMRNMQLAERMRPFWKDDFYALVNEGNPFFVDEGWCGWQLHRPAEQRGFFALFRRPAAGGGNEHDFDLHEIDAAALYRVEEARGGEVREMKGSELAHYRATLPPRGFQIVFYEQAR